MDEFRFIFIVVFPYSEGICLFAKGYVPTQVGLDSLTIFDMLWFQNWFLFNDKEFGGM